MEQTRTAGATRHQAELSPQPARKEKNFLTYRVDYLGYAHLCFYTHWEDCDMFTLSIVPDAHAKTPTYKLMSKQHQFVSLRQGFSRI